MFLSVHLGEDNTVFLSGVLLSEALPLWGDLLAVWAPRSIILNEKSWELSSGLFEVLISEDEYFSALLVGSSGGNYA